MPPKCPVCNSQLRAMTTRHINSIKHKEALEKQGINPEEDPALELIKPPVEVKEDETLKEEAPEKAEPKSTEAPKKLATVKLQPFKLTVQIPEKEVEAQDTEVEEEEEEIEYPTEKEIDLFIPAIPEPKKQKRLDTSGLTVGVLEKLAEMDSDNVNVVLVNCQRCNEVIPIPVPKDMVLNSELPVVAVSYIHKNKGGNDQHCLTLYLDHDFDIRRQRISEVIISE